VRHSDCCNRIRLAISELGGLSVPYTVGLFRTLEDERRVKVGREGVADILACIGGRFVAVEVKVGHDRQRPDQIAFQRAIEAANGLYVLAKFSDKEDGVATLREAVAC
jgi:hypothetical protein